MVYQYTYSLFNGTITIVEEDGYIIQIYYKDDSILSNHIADGNVVVEETTIIYKAKVQLEEYIIGSRSSFDLPLNPKGTVFQKQVWEELRKIPYGTTMTYKEIASKVGNSKASRAVGNANNKNPIMIVIPCHRVIGSNGSLVGYAGGLMLKEHLLTLEKAR